MKNQDPRIYTNLSALLALREESRQLSLSPRYRPAGMLSGRHASRIKGRGLNFEELRQYQAGDNIRQIDSRVSARLGKPYVRVYSEETDRPVHIIVDQRLPMFFGSQVNTKSVTAAHLAALLAWQVFDAGDRVGGVVLASNDLVSIPPKRSSHNVVHLLEAIVTANNGLQLSSAGNTVDASQSIFSMVRPLISTLSSQSVLILITDIEGIEIEELAELEVLSQKTNVLLFVIQDPLEDDLTRAHGLSVSHGEQQINIQANADNQLKYEELYQQRLVSLKKAVVGSILPVGIVNTYEPVISQLSHLLMGEPE